MSEHFERCDAPQPGDIIAEAAPVVLFVVAPEGHRIQPGERVIYLHVPTNQYATCVGGFRCMTKAEWMSKLRPLEDLNERKRK